MKRYLLNTVLVGFVFLLSCKSDEKIAPDLQDVSGPVEFEEAFAVSTTNPNFANGEKVYFSAKFKQDTYWVITIVGNTSGALQTIEGIGTSISASNATWDGHADGLPSFRAESVTVTISFPKSSGVDVSFPLSYTGTVAGTLNLNAGHVLITDFSQIPSQIQNVYDGNFAAVPANKWPSNWGGTGTHNDVPLLNPDGNSYVTMGPLAGWEPNADYPGHLSPYLDHLIITANSVGYPTYFPLIADPTKVYFNIMVYNSTDIYTRLQVTLYEDDPILGELPKSYDIYPDWNTGWKQLSINYLDFRLDDTTVVANNPQKIKRLQLTLLSNAPQEMLDAGANPVSASFDHLIFTHYEPYKP